MGGLYGTPQRHAMLSRAFELLNIKATNSYLFNPSSPDYQMMQQQQAEAQQQAEIQAQQQAEFNADTTSRQVAVMEGQLELDVMKEQNRMVEAMQKQEHKEEEIDSRLLMDVEKQNHDMDMDEKELNLEKKQQRNVSIG